MGVYWNIESSGTNIMMRGPIVRQLYCEGTEKERNQDPDEFRRFLRLFLHCQYTTVVKYKGTPGGLFGANTRRSHHLGSYHA